VNYLSLPAKTAIRDDEILHLRTCEGEDLDAMLVFNLLRTHSYLGSTLDAGLRKRNLTAAQFNTLLILRNAGPDGLLMGQVGERLVVTKSNVTGLIDRLEAQGLVTRREERDRRALTVRLTKPGAALLAKAIRLHARLLKELTRCLRRDEKELLVHLLTKLRRELRRLRKERS
jgi:MarR family 2-MHQ and catechol resistance regulon transcriptional repressor